MLELDHLVVAARSLDEGVAWCDRVLGVPPGPGGPHPLMGTHNRLLRIASPTFAKAYLEVIAIDPHASPPQRVRWFDLDGAAMRASVADEPRLIHWVARTDDIDRAGAAFRANGIDTGRVLSASRPTRGGELRWRITVRDDGRRPLGGVAPTLIQWEDTHPVDTMAASGISLEGLDLRTDAPALERALRQAGATQPIGVAQGAPALAAHLHTPLGAVTLSS
jgi:hypothetical protein